MALHDIYARDYNVYTCNVQDEVNFISQSTLSEDDKRTALTTLSKHILYSANEDIQSQRHYVLTALNTGA